MKDKDANVSDLLSKLSLKNNLDKEEDEEEIESVQVIEEQENQEDEYTSKGPVRGNNLHQNRANPYQKTAPKTHQNDVIVGRFIDDETEMEFIMSRMDMPSLKDNKMTKINEEGKKSNSQIITKKFP